MTIHTHILQDAPDPVAFLANGGKIYPVATLSPINNLGRIVHIIIHDGCYVLLVQSDSTNTFSMATHWFPDAVEVLKKLPFSTEQTG